MLTRRVIAVFDIGKTNKKFFLFDEDYHILFETSAHLPETRDDDGDPCEDIHALTRWISDTFHDFNSRPEYEIRYINYSTYGASFVHLGNNSLPCAPLYNYLKPFPEELKSLFYGKYGGEVSFAKATASPVLGSLNSGMILYYLKHRKPATFARIWRSVHLPQYVSSLFTSLHCSELTSIGCHTNLWDFQARAYHAWVEQEGIARKLTPIRNSNSIIEIRLNKKTLYSGIGLHDSSSALIPYLMSADEPFVLLSTGTWCITLNPFNNSPLTADELRKDCLCYLSYEGKPVKASRLFLGHIHDEKCSELTKRFGVDEDAYRTVEYIQDPDRTSPSFEHAYNALVRYLVEEQVKSTNLIMQDDIKTIFVDGGFGQNKIFMKLLADSYKHIKVYAASVAQASALGAALAVHWNWDPVRERKHLLKLVDFSSH
jgi:sugar (pentulose or hexulose) kinase